MKQAIMFVLAAIMLIQPVAAQNGPPPVTAIAAPTEAGAIPLYGKDTPGHAATENWGRMPGDVLMVRNVSRPTLTPVLPAKGKANGAAVIVAPGGAFMGLAIDHEGWQVARALAKRGYAAFVLKYRLVQTPADGREAGAFMGQMLMKEIGRPMEGDLLKQSHAPADARAAIAWVRAHSARWKIDAARVGIIGFSAGAMTARRVALDAPAAERPDFVGYIYGPQDGEAVPADAPPLFNAIAMDDDLFPTKGFAIAESWKAAKRAVEVHAYQKGGHGFGLGSPHLSNGLLIEQFVAWLEMQGFGSRKAKA